MTEGDLHVRGSLALPERELRWRFSRASGPGGQGVNTTDSRVELSFDVADSPSVPEPLRARALARLAGRLVDGVLTVVAAEHRSQLRNRAAARERLAARSARGDGAGPAAAAADPTVGRGHGAAGWTPRPAVDRSNGCAGGRTTDRVGSAQLSRRTGPAD